MEIVGQVLSGEFGGVLIRQKSEKELELGELLVADGPTKTILQIYHLLYGSQIQRQSLELLSGMELEGYGGDLGFMEENLRNYVLAELKGVVSINNNRARIPKTLPKFFSSIRRIEKSDFNFLKREENALFVGNVRSGSKNLDIPIELNGEKVFSHHILIPASTGKGKSNLVRVMAWSVMDRDYCGLLVLDPHDEYYGRNDIGLKDHPKAKEKLVYYSLNPPAGAKTLVVNIRELKPWFFQGVLDLSGAQRDALFAFFKKDKEDWLKDILTSSEYPTGVKEESVGVIIRKLNLLGISADDGNVACEGVFSTDSGEATLGNILSELESGKIVVVDTSTFSGEIELLVSSIIASRVFDKYKNYKKTGQLKNKPVVSIVLEEAPRVLGAEVLKSGSNIFSTIAREGRKFKVGLTAITQLPSLIPREILANMNTKIILGIEMEPERNAIIESASQDLSKDSRNIASLDIGEAVITSTFTQFAVPVSIPLFDKAYVGPKERKTAKPDLSGFR
ncbi:MAG: ATP-binding protein [Candidatus Altiarchaeota archaeon]|nr:ATP-binding protein [Candidatus Altiarchaeota archaeon]